MADNLSKRPKKGILKNSSSFDTQESHPSTKHKETKWDEMNIIATLHPAEKTYGHMKIDEPKTPYNYDAASADEHDALDATDLAARIAQGSSEPPKVLREPSETDESDEEEQTPEDVQQRKDFENKRKKHYNEYYALKLARKLLEEEEDDDEEGGQQQGPSGTQQNTRK